MGEPTPRPDDETPSSVPAEESTSDSPADETQAWYREESPPSDETDPEAAGAAQDHTASWELDDETTRLTPDDLARPAGEPGGTVIMPTDAPAWSGRAGVPAGPGVLRDSAPYGAGEPPPPRTWWTPVLLGFVALGLVGVVILAAWLITKDNTPGTKPTPTTTPAPQPTTVAPTSAAPPTATGSPSAQLVQVPNDLIGMTQDDAAAALDHVGLAYSLAFQASDQPKGTVIASSPEPGKLVPVNTVVKLLISLGSEETPTAPPSP